MNASSPSRGYYSPSRSFGSPTGIPAAFTSTSPLSSPNRQHLDMNLNLGRATEPLGLHCRSEAGRVMVTGIVRGSAAEISGIRPGDIVTKLGGYTVNDSRDMRRGRVVALDKGQLSIPIGITRDGRGSTPTAPSGYYSPSYSPSPDAHEAKQLGSLQAAYDNGGLTREEFRTAVTRIKGFSPWKPDEDTTDSTVAPLKLQEKAIPPSSTPAADESPATPLDIDTTDDRFRKTPHNTVIQDPQLEIADTVKTQPVIEEKQPTPPAAKDTEEYLPLTDDELAKFPKLDADTLRTLKHEFTKYDQNGDGVLTDKELLKAFLGAGMDPQNAHYTVQHALMFADRDGDGTIDYNEFVKYHAPEMDFDDEAEESLNDEEAAFLDTMNARSTKLSDLPPEIITQLQEDFAKIDVNGDGYLTQEELTESVKDVYGEFSDAIIEMFLGVADQDGDGRISYQEFMKEQTAVDVVDIPNIDVVSTGLDPAVLALIAEDFTALDQNGDGFLSEEELRGAIGGGDSPEAQFVLAEILRCDSDGDGRINYKEFVEHIKQVAGL